MEINTRDLVYNACITAMDKTVLNFLAHKDLIDRIDDFRYKNRFPTRAAAIKWLLEWALAQKPKPVQ